jgi:hypothetical protein
MIFILSIDIHKVKKTIKSLETLNIHDYKVINGRRDLIPKQHNIPWVFNNVIIPQALSKGEDIWYIEEGVILNKTFLDYYHTPIPVNDRPYWVGYTKKLYKTVVGSKVIAFPYQLLQTGFKVLPMGHFDWILASKHNPLVVESKKASNGKTRIPKNLCFKLLCGMSSNFGTKHPIDVIDESNCYLE